MWTAAGGQVCHRQLGRGNLVSLRLRLPSLKYCSTYEARDSAREATQPASALCLLIRCCQIYWRIGLDKATMFVHLKVNIVHANDTSNIFFVVAHRCRVFALLGSSEHASWRGVVVLVSVWIHPETLRDKPARPVGLLSAKNKQLGYEEHTDQYRANCIRLLVQEVISVHF